MDKIDVKKVIPPELVIKGAKVIYIELDYLYIRPDQLRGNGFIIQFLYSLLQHNY